TLGRPLNVHPALVKQGAQGAFGQAVRALLLATLDTGRLTQIAGFGFFSPDPKDDTQSFKTYDKIGNRFVPRTIFGTRGTVQGFIGHDSTGDPRNYGIELRPVPQFDAEALALIADSRKFYATATSGQMRRAAESFIRLQNPRLTKVTEVNCVLCHLTALTE